MIMQFIKLVLVVLFFVPMSLSGQCDMDRHNTSENTGWVSCTTAPNPNANRANGHWIMYDFTFDYQLQNFHIWNHNHPESLDNGVQSIVIDVSEDGINWSEVTTTVIPQASGTSRYEGFEGPMLNVTARYLLITALSNYGGSCSAFSEIRIGVADDIECQNYDLLVGDMGNRKYTATDYINTEGLVAQHKNVHFQTGSEVTLLEGFEAQSNADFLIEVLPCDNQ